MRLRLLPDTSGIDEKYQSKGKAIEAASVPLRVNSAISSTPPTNTPSRSLSSTNLAGGNGAAATVEPDSVSDKQEGGFVAEDDFELVDDPNEPIDGEDTLRTRTERS
ncbi:beige protein-like 1 [Metarhizium acridum]|nr:beige protein-like 1 [Metarhizium acridum]